ncbi:recombinase family protein [Kitasatospora sp. NPDC127116]|uniref:recombinase family protein n=1 Tax=Kitasatospora sp. NPDC127116 TaxID=3345367 RepID=UPI003631D848
MPDDHDLIPAIGYIRVSTYREEKISPELQRASIEAWAERRRRRIVHWVVDLDVTGRNFHRKIMKAIGYIEDGAAKEIAAWKYSRFGRQRHGNAVNLERLERAGGELVSSTEEVDARTAIGRFQRGMLLEVAAFESDRTGEQWAETHEWRRRQGLPHGGGRRFGYIWHPRKVPQPDGTFRVQREHYEINPAVAPAIIEIYQMYVDGTGFRVLANRLNAAGIRTARDTQWWEESLKRYMDSGFAAGYLRLHSKSCTCEPYNGGCPNHEHVKTTDESVLPPIISEELWQEYLARRALVKSTVPKSRAVTHPFSMILRCAQCGGSINKYRVKIYSYVRCNNRRHRSFLCKDTNMPYSIVEEAVKKWLGEITGEIDAEASRPVKKSALGDKNERRADELKVRIEKLEKAAVKHMRAFALAEGEDDALEAEFKATLAQLRAEKAEASTELAKLRGDANDGAKRSGARTAAPAIAIGLLEEWDTLPQERLNALLAKLIRAVLVGPAKKVAVVPVWAPADAIKTEPLRWQAAKFDH